MDGCRCTPSRTTTGSRSTAAGGSSCSDRPDEAPGEAWGEADVPGCWTMQGTWDQPHYTNVQMPFAGSPARDRPRRTRPASTSATFEVPAGWAGRRVVLHVGAAESVLLVEAQRRGGRGQQGLASRGRVRPDRVACGRARTTLRLTRREVVRRDVRRGPGPVVARRHHPLGVPVRDRPDAISPTSGSTPVCADDLTTGTLDLDGRRSACAGARARPGWRVEADARGRTGPMAGDVRTRRRRRARRPTGPCPGRRDAASSTSRASTPPAR